MHPRHRRRSLHKDVPAAAYGHHPRQACGCGVERSFLSPLSHPFTKEFSTTDAHVAAPATDVMVWLPLERAAQRLPSLLASLSLSL